MNLIEPVLSRFYHKFLGKAAEELHWQHLYGLAPSLAISGAATNRKPLLIITPDLNVSAQLEQELHFFISEKDKALDYAIPILIFPDREILPYDRFSPHLDIISQRMAALYQLATLKSGIVICAITTLMQRLPPKDYIFKNSFAIKVGETINLNLFRENLSKHSYLNVSKVTAPGEFAVRGSIIDVFPMGTSTPYRIDLFDNEIDSIRTFDTDTQRSQNKIAAVRLLPAREFPLSSEAINTFRQNWREKFSGNPSNCPIYQSISAGENFPGSEYYLNLFFPNPASLFDYFPSDGMVILYSELEKIGLHYWQEITGRYEQLRHDTTHPLCAPNEVFIPIDAIFAQLKSFAKILINPENYRPSLLTKSAASAIDFNSVPPEIFAQGNKTEDFALKLKPITDLPNYRILFCAETAGRRKNLEELLENAKINFTAFNTWENFVSSKDQIGIIVAPLSQGLHLPPEQRNSGIMVVTETQLFGAQVLEQRQQKRDGLNVDAIIRDLTELQIGAPVVHFVHGVGRYRGLVTLRANDQDTEFLLIEYAEAAKLYVPVSSINLISRYTGIDAEHAPCHHLGSKQWDKAKKDACKKIYDVAAELLEIYAKRNTSSGYAFNVPFPEYNNFANSFPFVETLDQTNAIADVIKDMASTRCMDRLICGDVGFGKTEVAMRAAFIAAYNQKQVVVLTPTTILAEQHFNNFKDRFANWPMRIEMLSRFRKANEQKKILEQLKNGAIDIIIGTHRLLGSKVQFKDLGLLIIDEEHRFGVKQKERLKALRPNIDILALTATPIPRSLNMAFANIRDFSLITTPPARRLSIKTFIHDRNVHLIREAILREIFRGGQVYFLHNNISTIEKTKAEISHLVPNAKIAIAHGQMRELQLEQIMNDFYHLRTNVLVCTTIIESGIDIPTANTIIIDRADRFGLAQLHQIRGRVGRSHHQAFAYLLVENQKNITADAKKRLDAISKMEDLGAGFNLAIHDLEIRGAGELLGEEQSGQIQNIGFTLYMELLEKTVAMLKSGKDLDLSSALEDPVEINLQIPEIIPEKYLDDVSLRLVLYKRIANTKDEIALADLKAEMIDRFGQFEEATSNLFKVTELKLLALKLGIKKITMGPSKGNIEFCSKPLIAAQTIVKLIQSEPDKYKFRTSSNLEFLHKAHTAHERIGLVKKILGELG